ncbi:MAG: nucleotidyltransferase family protein [Reyranella sp.]|nr:nucleotidyltransferase family protein [Reyranella sp.]MBL6653631.1 nucleotidyltransferase family protein [Reyranella sp.]
MIDSAMILAAGRGERMRPLTDKTPKPLIPVAGMSMLERSLDRLIAFGITNIVINVHYLGQQIIDRVQGRAHIIVEDRLLGTGGSVKNALPVLGNKPFFVVNGDGLWREAKEPILTRLKNRWDDERMDAFLLIQSMHKVIGREPKDRGDYFLEPRGRLRHRGTAPLSPYVFASLSICSPRLFRDSPDGPFSLLELWNRAEAEGRLYGTIHDGDWFHIGTAEALATAERILGQSPG